MAGSARRVMLAVLALALALGGALTRRAGAADAAGPQTRPTSQPSAEQVMRELLQQREPNPLIEPQRRPEIKPVSGLDRPVDPLVAGVARGGDAGQARREGELIVSRRGRLLHSPTGNAVFSFEGDTATAPEPPMIVVPCHMLEEMETAAKDRGDVIVFVVSGQVFAYHGVNYLLPTMMHIAMDQGNIKH